MNKEAQCLWKRDQSSGNSNIREIRAVLFSLIAFFIKKDVDIFFVLCRHHKKYVDIKRKICRLISLFVEILMP